MEHIYAHKAVPVQPNSTQTRTRKQASKQTSLLTCRETPSCSQCAKDDRRGISLFGQGQEAGHDNKGANHLHVCVPEKECVWVCVNVHVSCSDTQTETQGHRDMHTNIERHTYVRACQMEEAFISHATWSTRKALMAAQMARMAMAMATRTGLYVVSVCGGCIVVCTNPGVYFLCAQPYTASSTDTDTQATHCDNSLDGSCCPFARSSIVKRALIICAVP